MRHSSFETVVVLTRDATFSCQACHLSAGLYVQ